MLPVILLCLLSAVEAAAIHKRQRSWDNQEFPQDIMLPPFLFGYLADPPPVIKPNLIRSLKPQLSKYAKREVIRWGPFSIPGAPGVNETREPQQDGRSMDPMGYVVGRVLKEGLPKDVTVISGKSSLEYEDGSSADISNGIYLHHLIATDASKMAPSFVSFCAGDQPVPFPSPLGYTFLGTGNDEVGINYTTSDFKGGFYLKDDWMGLQVDLVNYSRDTKKVFVAFDMEYLPGKTGPDASSMLISLMGCTSQPGFWANEPVWRAESESFGIFEDGNIINAKGHLHDGGEKMELYLNSKLVCTSKARYGGSSGTMKKNGTEWQTISEMTICGDPIPVKKGDNLTMAGSYDTIKHPLRESHGEKMESMAMFSLTFLPTA